MRRSAGFTLIELMIVIAIIGVLAGIAVPQYTAYIKRAKFSEVISLASARKTAVYLCHQEEASFLTCNGTGLATDHKGIPADMAAPGLGYVESVTTSAGSISATGSADVNRKTYTLTPNLVDDKIVWISGGTCLSANYCR